MAQNFRCLRPLRKESLVTYGIFSLLVTFLKLSLTEASSSILPAPVVPESTPLTDEGRIKRNSEAVPDDVGLSFSEHKDKKIPKGFLGIRGKKTPSNFLGMRGRRDDPETNFLGVELPLDYSTNEFLEKLGSPFNEDNESRLIDIIKRTPSNFLGLRGKKTPSNFLGMRGKKIPSNFLGMRGKKVPSKFLGMRGKKTPSYFLGLRGKKDYDTYDDVNEMLQEVYENEDKRTPRGFLGMRGKKFESDFHSAYPDTFQSPEGYDVVNDVISEKRVPSAFLGMRG